VRVSLITAEIGFIHIMFYDALPAAQLTGVYKTGDITNGGMRKGRETNPVPLVKVPKCF